MSNISKEVYSPLEDSWLIEECILKENLVSKKCLDLGCGSGINSIAILRAGASNVLAVDINSRAIKETKIKVSSFLKKQNKENTSNVGHLFSARRSDLFSKINSKFDFISFNPPYVPTDEIKWVDLDGGKDGLVVINKFLSVVGNYLNKGGVVLLLISSLNKPSFVKKKLRAKGFRVSVVGRRKLFFEELLVLRCVRV